MAREEVKQFSLCVIWWYTWKVQNLQAQSEVMSFARSLNTKMNKKQLYLVYTNYGEAMAPHSSTLAWQTPWMEEPGGLQSIGSLRVGHN